MGNKFINPKLEKLEKKDKIKEQVEDFYLEDWTVMGERKVKIDDSIKFDNDLLITGIKNNPYRDYEVVKKLGEGSFGEVSLVKHKKSEVIRAMKVIIKKKEKGFNDLEILNEINILKSLDHPNIVKIFEFFMDTNNYYILTEYCEGGELFDAITKNEFTEKEVAFIMYQLLLAINYCHKRKIIHRDLKPENILISKKENSYYRIKICDFGTAQIFNRGDIQNKYIGSLYYVSPEVIQKNYNYKCDLWSCGIIMYFLLTGYLPFSGSDKRNVYISNVLKEDYDKEDLVEMHSLTNDLLDKLLQKDPNKRINAEMALTHKFFDEFKTKESLNYLSTKKINKYIDNLKKYRCKSIFQETALGYLIHNYPDIEEVSDAYKLFNKINIKGDGKITLNDFSVGISTLTGSEEMRGDIEEIFDNLDINKDNYIGYEEFARAVVDMKVFLEDKILKFVFHYFDKEDKGEITINDIKRVFGDNVNEKEIQESLEKIISDVDPNQDGKITYEEFCQIMKNLSN